jgi:transposase
MKRIAIAVMLIVASLATSRVASADALDQGRTLMRQGNLEAAAQFFNGYANAHPGDKKLSPEALAMTGRIMDALADSLTGAAEKKCYWKKGGSRDPDCMRREAASFNAKLGAGAFQYEHAITFIAYTGSHYRELLARYPKSKYTTEARFYLLLRELGGHPDQVLPKIKAFSSKYGKGEWSRIAQLLWARVNEDIWYVHREWSWVIYNEMVDPEEMIIRAEPYRQEALRTYKKLMGKKDYVGMAATKEYERLSANQADGHVYSIVNDANPKTLSAWGVDAPLPPPAK